MLARARSMDTLELTTVEDAEGARLICVAHFNDGDNGLVM